MLSKTALLVLSSHNLIVKKREKKEKKKRRKKLKKKTVTRAKGVIHKGRPHSRGEVSSVRTLVVVRRWFFVAADVLF